MAQQAQEVLEVLGGLALFADLTRPQLEEAAHTFEEEVFTEGQRILRQGFTGNSFYVILDGTASVILDGRDVAKLGRGDFFGEVSVMLGESPTADVVAIGVLRCLVLPGSQLQEFLIAHPRVMYRLLIAEAGRLRTSLQWRS